MEKLKDIATLRSDIDAVDAEIVSLLNKRAALALQIKDAKGSGPIYVPSREAELMRHLETINDGPLSTSALQAIYREIISSCRAIQAALKVSYLGPEGTYSEEAAIQLFGSGATYIACVDLAEVVRQAENNAADIALIPLENSTEGAVVDAHKLLMATNLQIINELYLPIRHNLLSKSSDMQAIQTVYAHSQALGQTRQWLRNHLPHAEVISCTSNAEAARHAQQDGRAAAIAGKRAAEKYELNILAENINDQATNTTRFVALGGFDVQPSGNDKTSIVCTLRDKPGALYEALKVFADRAISMTRLESQRYNDGEYAFYIDIAGHKSEQNIAEALQEFDGKCRMFKLLGSYPSAVDKERNAS